MPSILLRQQVKVGLSTVMLFTWVFISILFDVAFIMIFGIVKRLISAIRVKFEQSTAALKRFGSKRRESSTKEVETSSKPEHTPVLDYLDAGVQVNESMLSKHDREFPLVLSSDKDTPSYRSSKPIIHQDSQRPDVIPEEASDHESRSWEQRASSSPTAGPKPALKGSRSGSSADSLNSSKIGSDSGSSGSKKVSWEQVSVRSEDDKPTSSTSGAATPRQRRGSTSTQHKKVQEDVSAQVLELLPVTHQAAFQTFKKLCAKNSLLDRSKAFGKRDLQEGVNDDATLLSVDTQFPFSCFCIPSITLSQLTVS